MQGEKIVLNEIEQLRYDKLVNVTKTQLYLFARVVELVDALALGANRLACLFLYFIGVI